MKQLTELKWVLVAVAIILILMLLKRSGDHSFPGNLDETAEQAAIRAFLITTDKSYIQQPSLVILNLDDATVPEEWQKNRMIQVKFEDILSKDIVREIKNCRSNVVINHQDHRQAVKAWILLSQKGIENLYIPDSDQEDGEKLKFTFQADTTALSRLETKQEE